MASGQDRTRSNERKPALPLARAPAQRSLRQAGQGRRLSQPRRLQADRAGRALRPAEAGDARGRPGHRAGRLEQVVRKLPRRCHRRDRPAAGRADRGRHDPQMDFMADEGPGTADRRARRAARSRPVGHGRQHRRPQADRSPAHHGTGRGCRMVRGGEPGARAAPSSPRCWPAGPIPSCWPAQEHFRSVKHAKPPASRKGSSEWYVIAEGFKGAAGPF
jgi:hypothetical protein